MKNYYQSLVLATRNYILNSGLDGAILGVSGGIDSALVLSIVVDAIGSDKVEAVLMPSKYTSLESTDVAIELANNLGVKYSIFEINNLLQELKSFPIFQDNSEDIVEQNMQARIRGLILMSLSNKLNKIVLATGNRSEILTGYSTLYGDTCGGYAPLKYVYKTEVYQLAKLLPIPEFIINRAPTAELKFGQEDADSLPPYHILDNILRKLVDLNLTPEAIASTEHSIETIKKVQKLVHRSAYKRLQFPEGINVKGYIENFQI